MTALTLQSAGYRVSILPDEGGLIASLQYWDGADFIDLLRSNPGAEGTLDGLPLYGCFPMVPFANRLSEPWLPAGDDRRAVPVNWPAQGLAMHGTGFMGPWIVGACGDASALLTTFILDANGQTLGAARQTIALGDDGLAVSLAFESACDTPLSSGLGFHPWIAAPGDELQTTASFAAKGQFQMDANNLPVGHVACTTTQTDLDWRDAGLDTCFTGWSGEAQIVRPAKDLVVRVRSAVPNLHCFVAKDFDAICLEPVSHAPNAAHAALAAEIAPMAPVAPGETISIEMHIGGEPLSRQETTRTS
ncbi:aldose 1-epimerase [Roseobacter cerasinus]|uniref:Aldose 1-epimerase n=1 Tax=Roseobacter cerasinus TaxID=2602289 RepID=A0A640VQL3_9RHOB|nr:hypothetical protein [Roseobacter cerasinus]GFE49962.1 aldose 1-epimerase [Roseobacter cerasinus]